MYHAPTVPRFFTGDIPLPHRENAGDREMWERSQPVTVTAVRQAGKANGRLGEGR